MLGQSARSDLRANSARVRGPGRWLGAAGALVLAAASLLVPATALSVTGLTASPSGSIPYGASVTFTATFPTLTTADTAAFTTSLPSTATAITGCATQTVTSGVATCTTTTLPVGN